MKKQGNFYFTWMHSLTLRFSRSGVEVATLLPVVTGLLKMIMANMAVKATAEALLLAVTATLAPETVLAARALIGSLLVLQARCGESVAAVQLKQCQAVAAEFLETCNAFYATMFRDAVPELCPELLDGARLLYQ